MVQFTIELWGTSYNGLIFNLPSTFILILNIRSVTSLLFKKSVWLGIFSPTCKCN